MIYSGKRLWGVVNTTDNKKNTKRDMLLPMITCLCFIACSVLFLIQMIEKSQQDSITDLYNASNQTRTSIVKQIEGDWQTLEGLAVSLREFDINDSDQIMDTLKVINEGNAFIRMGYADIHGIGKMVDLDGNIESINLKNSTFFQRALNGEKSISRTFSDARLKDGFVNYFAVRIQDVHENTVGVICAVHSSVILRDIIDMPLLKNAGSSSILDVYGDFVLSSTEMENSGLLPENKEKIVAAMNRDSGSDLIITDKNGHQQMVVVLPLIKDQWYQVSMVPLNVLRSRYIQTAAGILAIIAIACCLFIWLINRQRRMNANNQKALMKLAYNDSLTQLRNFDGFKLDAKDFLLRNDLASFILWYADMKNFKFANDILGYEEGDRMLTLIGKRLLEAEGPDCMSCRISADNFAGIVRCDDLKDLEAKRDWILDSLKHAGMEGRSFLEIPMGVYRFRPGDETQPLTTLVNYANMAHKLAKERTGSLCVCYDDSIRKQMLDDSMLEAEAELAIKNHEFQLYMQPKIDIQNGNQLSGAEVLARWLSPTRGMISPGRFIPLFEQSELIVRLDRYMFENACRWYSAYLGRGGKPLNLAVNVSKAGILRRDFVEYYAGVKNKYAIPDGHLELEFTENILVADTDLFTELVLELRKNGFACSLDDFGSGYSSLNLLKDLPIDVLKLDILFFQKSKDIRRERIVVSNFINMAKQLEIKTIAEGVEDENTVEFLRSAGCDMIQGYIFAKPMPQAEFEQIAQNLNGAPFQYHLQDKTHR